MVYDWWKAHELELVVDAVMAGMVGTIFLGLWVWSLLDRRRARKSNSPGEQPPGP